MRTTVALMLCACSIHSVCANENTYTETPLTADARDHWAFQPRANVSAPQPKQLSTWCRTPIDRFIAAALEDRNLQPQPAASRQELVRRATLSLTGLPPKWKDVCRFAEDTSPKAFNRLVDELLESPSCGEHAAQFWLDLARFAETDGFEHDKIRSDAWKYRDWVIQAFNDDVPYDQFLRLQLAGDLLEPNHPDAHVATHFCVAGPDMPDINSQEERRHVLLNELTSTVGEVVLGLQVGCAECHDHKYDPISQADFYRLRSVFEPAIQLRKNVSVRTLVETAPYQQSSHVMIRGDFQRPGPKIQPAPLRLFRSTLSDVTASEMELAFRANRRKALADWVTQPDHPLTVRVIVNRLWHYHFGQGIVDTPSDFGFAGGKPSNPDFLLAPGELLQLTADAFTPLAFEQGEVRAPAPAMVQRLCAIRGEATGLIG